MSQAPFPDDVFRSDLTPMVGKKYGHLTVLAMAGRKAYRRGEGVQRIAQVRVLCDCGNEYVTDSRAVRRVVNRCRECAKDISRENGLRFSVRLPSGRTVAEIARATGIPLDTVYHRWIRGWPESDLSLPLAANRKPRTPRFRPEVQP